MARIITILILLTIAAGYAHALGIGGEGLRFGRVGATAGKAKGGGGGGSGALLLEDGSSILLLEDGSSFFCLEGGC